MYLPDEKDLIIPKELQPYAQRIMDIFNIMIDMTKWYERPDDVELFESVLNQWAYDGKPMKNDVFFKDVQPYLDNLIAIFANAIDYSNPESNSFDPDYFNSRVEKMFNGAHSNIEVKTLYMIVAVAKFWKLQNVDFKEKLIELCDLNLRLHDLF